MNLPRVLEQLRSELKHLDAAIASLERLHGRRRGRPPALPPAPGKTQRRKRRSEPNSRGPANSGKTD